MIHRARVTAAAIGMGLALALAACGSSSSTGASSGPTAPETSSATSGSAAPLTGVTLVVSEAGGPSGEVMQSAYLDPFTAETGIAVERVPTADLGKLQAAAKAGTHEVDVAELDSISAVAASALGLTEEIDYAAVDPEDPLDPAAKQPFGMGYQVFSTVPSWREGAAALSSFTDFFDPEGFPGRRSIPDYPSFAIPIALIGDGVDPDKLYPIDLDRAFAALDRIKGDLVLWKSGAEPLQQMQSGEVDYAAAWSGRIAGQDGVAFTYNQGMLDIAYLTVPKGGSQAADVWELLHSFTVLDRQVAAVEGIPYPAPAKDLIAQLPPELAAELPTSPENAKLQFSQDPVWWATNYEKVAAAWEEWKLTL